MWEVCVESRVAWEGRKARTKGGGKELKMEREFWQDRERGKVGMGYWKKSVGVLKVIFSWSFYLWWAKAP